MTTIQTKNIRNLIKKSNVDAILLKSETNRYWLTEFHSTLGYLICTPEKNILLVDGRYYEMAQENAKNVDELIQFSSLFDDILDVLQKNNITKLGIEKNYLTVGEYLLYEKNIPKISLHAVDCTRMRMKKTENELKHLKKAAEITDEIFTKTIKFIKSGMSEKDIANFMYNQARLLGAEKESFDYIIASGHRSSLPHGVASDKIIEENEFITLDFGVKYKGFCSDMTRNIFVGRCKNFHGEHEKLFNTVREAQQVGIDALKPGVKCSDIDKLVRKYIDNAGYKGYFSHGLGHGLGIDIHEAPYLSPKDNEILQENMVVTVEPGIYLPNLFGSRIEDDLVITKNGSYSLNSSNRNVVCTKND